MLKGNKRETKIDEMPDRMCINIVRIAITKRNGQKITLTEPFDIV